MAEFGRVPYAVRESGCRPGKGGGNQTFSVGIGIGPKPSRWNPALYRVAGNVRDEAEVDALAARLVTWLNDPAREGRSPCDIPWSNDKSATIRLTPAGRTAGWLKP